MTEKLKKVKNFLTQKQIGSFLFTNFYSILYLVGFKGVVPEERECFVVYSGKKFYLIAPKLYQTEAKSLESDELKVIISDEREFLLRDAVALMKMSKGDVVSFEFEDLKYNEFKYLKKALSSKKLLPMSNVISDLRVIKTADEIELIKKAQDITYKSLKNLIPFVKPGITEKELAVKLKSEMIRLGAEDESFGSIIASGKGSALPHYATSNKKLKKGDLVLFDIGAKYKGYCGDTTRVLFLGNPNAETLRIYNLVKEAQEKAIKEIKAGMTGSAGYTLSNSIFEKSGVSTNFTHGLGHGIGMAVHEEPYLRKSSNTVLKEGMVFSIEPGLYFEKWGGIRLEDLVVCQKDKVEILGKFTKEPIIL